MRNKYSTEIIALNALIAALYAGLSIFLAPLSFGALQFRLAEAITLLPFYIPVIIPGLTIGCFISNLFGGFGIIDAIIGSLATFIAATITSRTKNIFIATLPPVIINAVAVGGYISVLSKIPMWLCMLQIGASQAVICLTFGIPLVKYFDKIGLLNKYKKEATEAKTDNI